MLSLSDNNQADIVEAFNSTSRHQGDLLKNENPYFEQMVSQIYPTERQLDKANSFDSKAPFLELGYSITNGIVLSKTYNKQEDSNFEFPFPRCRCFSPHSYGVYIWQLTLYARV